MSNTPPKKRKTIRNFSTLLVLVAFVFAIMLVSILIACVVMVALLRMGVITLSGERNIIASLLFLLLISLGMGSVLAVIGGTRFLRPLRRLIDATQEISAGNFEIRVEETGNYEMHRLINNFNLMAKELGSIETLRNDFVRNVSHEFKTPVSTIQGFVKLLKLDTLTAEQRNEYLDVIDSEAERLIQLSSNVLLLSNLDSVERMPQKNIFALDEQLRQTVLQFETQLEEKKLDVEVDLEDTNISGIEELLKQVWINLLNNAIKFTAVGGTVKVALAASQGYVTVTIADSGIGMTPEVQEHLFDRFYQGDASHATQGNGLGLSLVQRILSLCDGEISVYSKEGEGSAFRVVLPTK